MTCSLARAGVILLNERYEIIRPTITIIEVSGPTPGGHGGAIPISAATIGNVTVPTAYAVIKRKSDIKRLKPSKETSNNADVGYGLAAAAQS